MPRLDSACPFDTLGPAATISAMMPDSPALTQVGQVRYLATTEALRSSVPEP